MISNVITEGLLFHYDMKDPRSFLGKPTSNFVNQNYSNIQYDEYPLNEIIELEQTPGTNKFAIRSTAIEGSSNTLLPVSIENLQPDKKYVASCWYCFTDDWDGNRSIFYIRMHRQNDAFTDTSQTSGIPFLTKTIQGQTWIKAYYPFVTPSDFNGQCEWYIGYPAKNSKGHRLFLDLQVEDGESPGKYLTTSITPIESIIDLTGQNIITVNSLSYELTELAECYWNGKSDFISLSNLNIPKGVDNFTYSCKINFFSKPKLAMIFETGAWPNGFFARFENDGISVYSMRRVYGKFSFDPTINEWYDILFVRKDGQLFFYVNGHLSSSFPFAPNLAPNTDLLYIGKAQHIDSQFFNGKISSFSVYNRALTDEEILKNFESSK